MNRYLTAAVAGLFGFAAFADIAPVQWGSEPGFSIIQQQCMKCHGKANMPQAPGVAALREFPGEKIYEFLITASDSTHQTLNLSE
jgi:mono/diheme cytochrome c family protein